VEDLPASLPQELLQRLAGSAHDRLVGRDDAALRVQQDNRLAYGLEDVLPFLACPDQFTLGMPALGHFRAQLLVQLGQGGGLLPEPFVPQRVLEADRYAAGESLQESRLLAEIPAAHRGQAQGTEHLAA